MQMCPVARKGSFWRGKTPCWVMRECSAEARVLCPAYRRQSRPCWEEVCLCKKLLKIDTCFACEVFEKYGGEPTHSDCRPDAPDGWE